MKTCLKCNIEKPIAQYNKNKSKKDQIDIYCKECIKEKAKKYYNQYIPLIANDPITNKICCRCKIEKTKNLFNKCYKTKDGLLAYCKECNSKNRNNSSWYKNQYNEYKKKWVKNKHKNDPIFKLKNNLRCRMNSILKKQKTYKNNSSLLYLGCSLEEYKQYIEKQFLNGMAWENHGKIWEIDHIIPLASFDLLQEENIHKAFNYKNTMPRFKTTKIAELFNSNQIGNREKGDR